MTQRNDPTEVDQPETVREKELAIKVDELERRVREMEGRSDFGLTWEHLPEDVETRLATEVPVLVEAPKLAVNGALPSERPHILIEGDNLHALHTLQATHKGQVDVIYIDPPYNTGKAKEWKYNDKYVDENSTYRHSKWLSFMEKRLRLALPLLKDDGVIFISIDDHEYAHLRILTDTIFGESNWLATFVWRTNGNIDNQAKVKGNHEYILAYAKQKDFFDVSGVIDSNIEETSKLYSDEIRNSVVKNGPKNPISSIQIPAGFPAGFETGVIQAREDAWPHLSPDVVVKDGETTNPVVAESGWANARLLKNFIAGGFADVVDSKGQETRFEFTRTGAIENVKVRAESRGHILTVLMNLGTTETAGNELKAMGVDFNFPKPVPLISFLLSIFPRPDAVVLDFFAGSGTTLHAVTSLNAADSGNRQCVLVTNNENEICKEVTQPRAVAVLTGQWATGSRTPLPGSLRYFRTDFIARRKNLDTMRTDIAKHTVDLVAVKESTGSRKKVGDGLSVLFGERKSVAVLTDFVADHADARSAADKLCRDGDERIAYVFTWSDHGVEEETIEAWDGWSVSPLPAQLLSALRRTAPTSELPLNFGGEAS